MDEYIEREKVVEFIKNYGKGAISDGMKTLDHVDDIILLSKGVYMIPAADVVEVVRCKDCKNYKQNPWNEEEMMCMCWSDWLPTEPNDFCSYGAKMDGKDGADNDR